MLSLTWADLDAAILRDATRDSRVTIVVIVVRHVSHRTFSQKPVLVGVRSVASFVSSRCVMRIYQLECRESEYAMTAAYPHRTHLLILVVLTHRPTSEPFPTSRRPDRVRRNQTEIALKLHAPGMLGDTPALLLSVYLRQSATGARGPV